jgi:hypothetical protein
LPTTIAFAPWAQFYAWVATLRDWGTSFGWLATGANATTTSATSATAAGASAASPLVDPIYPGVAEYLGIERQEALDHLRAATWSLVHGNVVPDPQASPLGSGPKPGQSL